MLISGWVSGSFPINPTAAHEIQTSQSVAATFHLEPNHQPKVNQPTQVWFALTRSGRQLIPLGSCICQLKVYQITSQGKSLVLQPPLKALNVERYLGIPSAAIIFPRSGMYRLELTGQPKTAHLFQPFRFSYQVVVTR
jgi:hypothetical protein